MNGAARNRRPPEPASRRPYFPYSGLWGCRGQRGFSLIEMLVVIAILMTAATLGFPALNKLMKRTKLVRFTQELSFQLQASRQEAIRMRAPVVARPDFGTNEMIFFANVDDDADLQFNPNDAVPFRTADYELARIPLPNDTDLAFHGPMDAVPGGPDAVDGFTANTLGEESVVFEIDGSVRDVGAFRIADSRNNFLEIRVAPAATARIEMRKYHFSPPWGDPAGFFPPGKHPSTEDNFWEWY